MKNICRKWLITAALLIPLSGVSRAEEVDLDKIVVTPSRIEESSGDVGRAIDVVTSKEIEEGGAQNVADALTNLTSVDISNYGGPGTSKNIRMRGSTSAQVLVMIDGRPVNSPRDGQVDLNTIPMDDIKRIELLHGPSSSLYGSSAMGGVVNIITKNPPVKGQKTEAYSAFGTNHAFIDRLSQGARIGNFGYLISGGYESSGGFRPNAEFNSKDFNAKFEYKLNNANNIFLNSGFYKSRVGAPGSLSDPDQDNKQVNIKNFFDFGWNFNPDEKTKLKARIYNNDERLEFIPNSLDSVFEILGLDPTTKSVQSTDSRGLDIQFNKQLFDRYLFLCGYNYVGNYNDSTDSAKHKYTVNAWYLDNQLDLTKDLKVTLGARIDDYSNFGAEISPNASFVYNFQGNLKIHGLISRSFRAPTFNDLYWNQPGMLGNPNLKPEEGLTGEIGVESKLNNIFGFGITYYRSKYNELIQWAPLTDDPASDWTVKNIGSATIDGIELSNKMFITDNLEAGLNYSFMIAKDDKTHEFLIYQPQNKVDFSLKYDDLKGFLIELKGQFTDSRFINETNTASVKQFFVLGLSASKKIGHHLTYFISIDNLLNRKYQVQFGYPMPGFSFTGGLKAEF